MSEDAAPLPRAGARDGAGRLRGMALARRFAVPTLSVLAGLLVWQLASMTTTPLFLPSPLRTLEALVALWRSGTLVDSVLASARRIFIGWAAGVAVGVVLGLLMGTFRPVRQAFEPYIEFFRFVPPTAFVTLAVIWLGPGDASKIALIFYATVFIVTLNTMAGTMATSPLRIHAAASLGAGPLTILTSVIVPSAVPYIVTGTRIAMGNSFLTIVVAEIVAAQVGLGALIWNARNYARTDWVFGGIIVLGLLGFAFDRLLRLVAVRALKRYQLNL
ncbi:ABC transporter permease [Aureimonas populi]|uniref:ABC transporter permease n=1 Tax=Aureimonas populi TaxID=1701758 RepID=A0ABW5CKI9_9HYPH|nr:ABC transporter permease [Aureimonas populi]